jgi:hypothetical protein
MAELVDSLDACPYLQELAVEIASGGGDSLCRALAEAMREGGLSRLERLSLMAKGVGHDSAKALAEALAARGLRFSHDEGGMATTCALWVRR